MTINILGSFTSGNPQEEYRDVAEEGAGAPGASAG